MLVTTEFSIRFHHTCFPNTLYSTNKLTKPFNGINKCCASNVKYCNSNCYDVCSTLDAKLAPWCSTPKSAFEPILSPPFTATVSTLYIITLYQHCLIPFINPDTKDIAWTWKPDKKHPSNVVSCTVSMYSLLDTLALHKLSHFISHWHLSAKFHDNIHVQIGWSWSRLGIKRAIGSCLVTMAGTSKN